VSQFVALARRERRIAASRRPPPARVDTRRASAPGRLSACRAALRDAVIDAVAVDAERPKHGPAAVTDEQAAAFDAEVQQVAPDASPDGFGEQQQWKPGDGPSQVAQWAVASVAKYGRIGIIGVYGPTAQSYPIGEAMNKNLTIRMGNCDHHSVTPPLIDMVAAGQFDPTTLITEHEGIGSAIAAYEAFDRREPGWIKVELTDLTA
jgi:threonine dehydrogenase-like Zn-dependent dehydrogenase